MLEDWHCETSSSPKSTGSSSASSREEYSIKLKLIRLNSHHDRFCKSRRKLVVFNKKSELRSATIIRHHPESLASRWKLQTREVRTCHSIGLFFERQKKQPKKWAFFVRKITFWDVKEHLRNIFFKSACCYCDKSFKRFCPPNSFFLS